MEDNKVKPTRISEKYGLMTAAGLIVYFFLMKILGLVHVVELRALNIFILGGGILMALRAFRREQPDKFEYFPALGTGALTSIVACVVFSLFTFFYLNIIDPALMQAIVENDPMGRYLNPYLASVIISIEGIASGLLITFIIVNYMEPVHKPREEPET